MAPNRECVNKTNATLNLGDFVKTEEIYGANSWLDKELCFV